MSRDQNIFIVADLTFFVVADLTDLIDTYTSNAFIHINIGKHRILWVGLKLMGVVYSLLYTCIRFV